MNLTSLSLFGNGNINQFHLYKSSTTHWCFSLILSLTLSFVYIKLPKHKRRNHRIAIITAVASSLLFISTLVFSLWASEFFQHRMLIRFDNEDERHTMCVCMCIACQVVHISHYGNFCCFCSLAVSELQCASMQDDYF